MGNIGSGREGGGGGNHVMNLHPIQGMMIMEICT